ncbi:hypothetical protein D3C71_1527870 [compost metagenome]
MIFQVVIDHGSGEETDSEQQQEHPDHGIAMTEFTPANVPAACQQNQPARNPGNPVLDAEFNETVVAVRNVNAVVLGIAAQHVAERFFARSHSCRMLSNQFPALMEEAGATTIGMVHRAAQFVTWDGPVSLVVAETGEGSVPAGDCIGFQTLPARIGFPGCIAQ